MAVDDDTDTGPKVLLLSAPVIACASSVTAPAEAPPERTDGRTLAPYEHTTTSTRGWWREGATRLACGGLCLLLVPV